MTRPGDEVRPAVPATFGAPSANPAAPPAGASAAAPPPAAGHRAAAATATAAAEAPALGAPSAARTGTDVATATAPAALATATTDTLTRARTLANPLAAPDGHHQGPPPSPNRTGGMAGGPDGGGPSGRMARLRIGSHTVSPAALARLSPATSVSGLVLGGDRRRAAVSIRLFRPEPTRVALVGGVWAGQLVAFRALALGARIVVLTADPTMWTGFGAAALGHAGDRVEVRTDRRSPALSGTPQRPALVIHDLASGMAEPPALGPWQTQLTILRQLDTAAVATLRDSQLCVLQRLTPAEAAVAESALRLPADSIRFLQVMADDMLTLVGDGADRHLWVNQTEVERRFLGAPWR
jgi:hypothetical protein